MPKVIQYYKYVLIEMVKQWNTPKDLTLFLFLRWAFNFMKLFILSDCLMKMMHAFSISFYENLMAFGFFTNLLEQTQ